MEMLFSIIVFVFGAIVGSFLNVVIYRLHTGRSINGRSHCMSCGETLRWYELFPIVSFITLRARCRTCSSSIPLRYLTIELITGITFLVLWSLFSITPVLFLLYAVLAAVLIVLATYDIRHTIIPNELTIAVGGIACLNFLYDFLHGQDVTRITFDVVGGVLAGGFFYGLWYFSQGRWIGLGDAKLALPLGMIIGIGGVFSMVVLSFWAGAAISLFLIGIKKILEKGKTVLQIHALQLTMKSEVPFAPFLIVGFVLVELFHVDIFIITSYLIPF